MPPRVGKGILYFELKSGYNDDGPAWIGRAKYSKSGRTIYSNGRAFRRMNAGAFANAIDVETGENYWISGVKKDMSDRHWAGGGIILVDRTVVDEYLKEIGAKRLNARLHKIADLDHSDITERIRELENNPSTDDGAGDSRHVDVRIVPHGVDWAVKLTGGYGRKPVMVTDDLTKAKETARRVASYYQVPLLTFDRDGLELALDPENADHSSPMDRLSEDRRC